MLAAIWAWLLAGTTPHWHYLVAGLLAGLLITSELFSLTKRIKANGVTQGLANLLLLVLGPKVPLLSKVVWLLSSDAAKQALGSKREPPDPPPGTPTLAFLMCMGLLGMVMAGCGASAMAITYKTTSGFAGGIKLAADAFVKYDRGHQLGIVSAGKAIGKTPAEIEADLEAYRKQRAVVETAFKVAKEKLEIWHDALPLVERGLAKSSDVKGYLDDLYVALNQLYESLRALGVQGLPPLTTALLLDGPPPDFLRRYAHSHLGVSRIVFGAGVL